MKSKIGAFFMTLGVLLMLASVGLLVYNDWEQAQAGQAADAVMPELVAAIVQRQQEADQPQETEPEAGDATEPEDPDPVEEPLYPEVVPVQEPETKELPVVEVDGYSYIGFLTIPSLELELPVMADWSYPQLKLSPCRYVGDTYTDDLVIMAHNYDRHFGHIKELKLGDTVAFTDMDGNTTYYQVVATDVLYPSAVQEMTSGDYDLTLFTCTYGGRTRVTVRCERASND